MRPEGDERLDVFVARAFGLDRLAARRWILAGAVDVEGRPIKPSLRLWPEARVVVTPPPPRPSAIAPEDLPLRIVHADPHLVVVDKPAGMATHPGPGWWRGSALNALLFRIPDWPGVGGVAQPGVVHRLDRDTTGLLVVAKTDAAHQSLLAQVRARTVVREYRAWVQGDLTGSGSWEWPLDRDPDDPERVIVTPDGKPAVTHYEGVMGRSDRSLVRLTLETGRTHQIRVHAAHAGHPVLGDRRYHPGPGSEPLRLHAGRLGFSHPADGTWCDFTADPPWGTDPA